MKNDSSASEKLVSQGESAAGEVCVICLGVLSSTRYYVGKYGPMHTTCAIEASIWSTPASPPDHRED